MINDQFLASQLDDAPPISPHNLPPMLSPSPLGLRRRNCCYTRHGILSNKYTQADFTLCSKQLLKDSEINRDKHVSLCEAWKFS